MMRKCLTWTAALAVCAFCATTGGVRAADGAGLKIAVVRIQDAFSDYERTKAMKKDIEDTFAPDQKAIEDLNKKVEEMKNALRADTMTEPGSFRHYEKQQEIKTKMYLLKSMQEDLRREWNERMIQFYKTVYADFQAAVKEFASQNGYDLVLRQADEDLSNNSALGIQNEIGLKILHYVSPSLDKTREVVEIMNRKWRKARAAAAKR